MALEQFIEISGINGEASAPDVHGAIPVQSWSFGVSQPAVEGMRSVAEFSGFHFTKRVDSTTPLLFALCAQAVTTPQAKLVVRSTGHRDPRVVVDLRDVIVAEISATFDAERGDLWERVSLRFGKVWFGGAVIDRRGTSEQVNWFAWDLAENRPATGS